MTTCFACFNFTELQPEAAETLLTISKHYLNRYFPSKEEYSTYCTPKTVRRFSARLKEVLKDLVFIPVDLRCLIPLSSYRKCDKQKTPLPVTPSVTPWSSRIFPATMCISPFTCLNYQDSHLAHSPHLDIHNPVIRGQCPFL